MNKSIVICPINGLPARFYVKKGRADYFIEPVDGIIFQSKLPSVSVMESFNQEEYRQGRYRAYYEMSRLKKRTAESRLMHIKQYGKRTGRLLDVGCSVGFFLEVAQDAGFKINGIELSSEAISMASDAVRDYIYHADANTHIREFPSYYDVVTAYDIIEHTQDPKSFLNDLFTALKPGGTVAIAAPDTDHWLRFVMRGSWSMLQPMQHTYLFSRRSIKRMLNEAGFQDIVIKSAKKTLTLNYLFGQLSQTNPIISKLLNCVSLLLPNAINNAPIEVNIGEFFALARKTA